MIYFRSYVSHLTIARRMISHLPCTNIPLFSHPANRPVFTNILIHIIGGIHFSAAAWHSKYFQTAMIDLWYSMQYAASLDHHDFS